MPDNDNRDEFFEISVFWPQSGYYWAIGNRDDDDGELTVVRVFRAKDDIMGKLVERLGKEHQYHSMDHNLVKFIENVEWSGEPADDIDLKQITEGFWWVVFAEGAANNWPEIVKVEHDEGSIDVWRIGQGGTYDEFLWITKIEPPEVELVGDDEE